MKKMNRIYQILIMGWTMMATSMTAQVAESIVYREIDNPVLNRFVDCSSQDAGTHFYGVGIGETQDFNPMNLATIPSRLTFCFGDSLEVRHSMGDLTGDPDTATPPGFGYAIYTCIPTITGPTLQDIEADPCILRNTMGDIQIYTQSGILSGNVDFFNQGAFQAANGGDPIQMWFAPITYDYFDGTNAGYEIDPADQPEPGPCVDVNVQDTFSVLYLNPIVIDILDPNVECGGQLRITGGMPEYYDEARSGLDKERYTINIVNEADPTIVGNKCGGGRPVHDEEFFFVVPEAGRYRILVTDAKGCNVSDELIDISCDEISVFFGASTNVMPGDQHCVEITVTNYTDILSSEFNVLYDPAVFMFSNFTDINPLFSGVTFVPANPTPGQISFVTFDFSQLITVPDNEILFTACFDAIGNEGDCTMFELNPDPILENAVTNGRCELPVQFFPSQVCISSTSIDGVTCSTPAGTSDGSIIFGPTTGTPGFTYIIEDDLMPRNIVGTGTFNNIGDQIEHTGFAPGIYNITITDAAGQDETGIFIIEAGERITITDLIPTNPTCVGRSDGQIQLVTSGGIGMIDNAWTGPNSFTATNTNPITGLEAGMYNVLVTDANGCPAESMRNLSTDSIFVTIMAERLTSCPGGTDGRVFAQATGGTAPYDFTWNGGSPDVGQISSTLENAPSGQQVLVVADANGCSIRVDTFSLGSFNELDVDSTFNDLTCFGQNDGAISIDPLSGVGPFTYDWNDIGLGSMDRTNLAAGDYRVLVTDSEGCFDSLSFSLTSPDSLNVFVDSTLSSSFICFGDMNGRIILNALGGDFTSGTPTVVWTNNVSDNFGAVNLGGGTYDITTTDSRGCIDLTTFTIQEASSINYTIPPLAEPNCPGDSTVLQVINASGGAGGPYLFNVNGGRDYLVDSTTLLVPAGTYTIEVTDTIGCSDITSVSVDDPDGISIFLPDEIIINLGDSSQFLSPDIRPLAQRDSIVRYQWTPPTGLSCDTCAMTGIYVTESDTYTLEITDVKGCTYSEDVLVRSRKIRNVFVPNAFTPNGDGENPLFTAFTGQGVNQILTFRVFNRWGNIVYDQSNIPGGVNGQLFGWDGTDGEHSELPIGVYVYAIEVQFIDGVEITYKGDVTLLR